MTTPENARKIRQKNVSVSTGGFFFYYFPFLEWWKFAVSSTPKTSKNHTEKTRFSHNEGENCGEKKKEAEAKEQCDREEEA
jgi:hypothetical protein